MPRSVNLLMPLVLAALLAGCGINGAPRPPASQDAPASGVSVSGTARVGITQRL